MQCLGAEVSGGLSRALQQTFRLPRNARNAVTWGTSERVPSRSYLAWLVFLDLAVINRTISAYDTVHKLNTTELRGLSSRANYTNRATAGQRS
jgi:hypothetical protein